MILCQEIFFVPYITESIILYNEIKIGQKEQNEKLIQVINRQNEIGEKNIDALIRNNTLFEQLLNYFINDKN